MESWYNQGGAHPALACPAPRVAIRERNPETTVMGGAADFETKNNTPQLAVTGCSFRGATQAPELRASSHPYVSHHIGVLHERVVMTSSRSSRVLRQRLLLQPIRRIFLPILMNETIGFPPCASCAETGFAGFLARPTGTICWIKHKEWPGDYARQRQSLHWLDIWGDPHRAMTGGPGFGYVWLVKYF